MINPDHIKGAALGVGTLLLTFAVAHMVIAAFGAAQLAELVGFPGGAGATYAVARFLVACAAIYTLAGLIMLFIGLDARGCWLLVAFVGFAIFAACLATLAFFASPSMYEGYGFHLFAGVVAGLILAGFAAQKADKIHAKQVADAPLW